MNYLGDPLCKDCRGTGQDLGSDNPIRDGNHIHHCYTCSGSGAAVITHYELWRIGGLHKFKPAIFYTEEEVLDAIDEYTVEVNAIYGTPTTRPN